MKIYKTQKEFEKDIKNGVFTSDESIEPQFNLDVEADIVVKGDIIAGNINAMNINAWDIIAGNINALNINAGNINALNITADNISYYAFCSVYNSIECTSIKWRRDPHADPICLEGELIIKDQEVNPEMIDIDGKPFSKSTIKEALKRYVEE
jgi:hypothetical protein